MKNYSALATDRIVELPKSDKQLELTILNIFLYHDKREELLKLKDEDFYNTGCQLIFREFVRIADNGDKIDINLIPLSIKSLPSFKEMIACHGFDYQLATYIRQLKKISHQRKIQGLAYESTIKVKEDKDPLEIKSWTLEELDKIQPASTDTIQSQNFKVIEDLYAELEREDYFGIATGYSKLDHAIRGFTNGTLTIVGGTPGVGKTTWLLNIVNHIAKQNKKVLYVSLEMSYIMLQMKLVSIITGLSTSIMMSMRKNIDEQSWYAITQAMGKLANYNIYRLGKAETTINDIENAIRSQGGFDIVFVDYLQLLSGNGKTRYESISEISRGLKKVSTKYDMPIVVVASINRAYKDNPDKKPAISDLRDSGNIEYDADTILFLHRASAFRDYDSSTDEMTTKEFEHHAELIIAKNRYGMANKSIDFYFDGEKSKFNEMEV